MLERLFHLSDAKTTVRTELLAGITTFLTMSYIIFVQHGDPPWVRKYSIRRRACQGRRPFLRRASTRGGSFRGPELPTSASGC